MERCTDPPTKSVIKQRRKAATKPPQREKSDQPSPIQRENGSGSETRNR